MGNDGGDASTATSPPPARTDTDEPVDVDTATSDRDRRGRGRRVLLVVLGVAVALVALAAAWYVFGGDQARETTEESARDRLAAGSVVTTGPTDETVADAGPLAVAPTQGVYRYRGAGHEETSFPPLVEDQGPAMPATVTATADGCWVLRIDYNSHHWQDWTYCTGDGQLTERGGSTYSRRSVGTLDLENTSTFVCDPAVVVVDDSDPSDTVRQRSCVGSGSLLPDSTTAAGTMTNLGREIIDIGGAPVETVHIRDDLTYTGAQTGTETTDTWFAVDDGMPVRNEHHVVAVTDTPVGGVTYTEDAQYQLESLERS